MYLSYDMREYDSVGFGAEINPLSDVRVRQAMYHAIDIEYIIENILNGFGEPASQFVSPLIFGYNPEIERLDFDVDEAKKLMVEAGYSEGFEIDLDCTDDNTTIEFCEVFQQQLAEINITVNLVLNTVEEFYQKIDSRNSQFYFIGWLTGTADGGEIFDFLLRSYDEENSTGLYNCGYYCNCDVDNIADEINTIMDPEKRLKKLQEGFEIAMNDVAWIPLYIPQSKFGSLDTINLNPRADLAYRVEDIGFV
jgi:peptide/nickel transport system substrate-binding protein